MSAKRTTSPRKSGKEAAKGAAAAAPKTLPLAVSSEASHPARQRIIDGARQHFLAHGFRGVTMDDLAEELAMSKKTLYAHFSSKLELVEAVMRDKLKRVMSDLERITGDAS
ncbi:MAG TPA: helix-turn-helix domain-containing protein, partial [Candidatus Saccharimonadia bacterium]|nr:helix-turn-helix domain-containing protein [Candidatus Saccharimonadia bacterium]